jgi:glycosyltransferase involved in cell wall biosynthesis
MLAYTYYEMDNRVRRYAETLSKMGHSVSAVALRKKGQPKIETINGVIIHRIQERVINEKGKLTYLYRLIKFFINSFIFISTDNFKKRYDLIHVHSVPDFEVFATLLPKLLGTKIILDIHDIVPEFYMSKFKTKDDSLLFKALLWIEKISCAFADHVIISNHLWYDVLTNRSVKKSKCTTILNYPNQDLFYKREKERNNSDFVIMYPGTLNRHQGLDVAVKGFSLLYGKIPNLKFYIYGMGPAEEELKELIELKGLQGKVIIMPPVSTEKIAQIMANADIGIIPKRNDSFGGEAFSTKTLEFMALGIPIIVSKTKIDQFYYNDDLVKYFEPENEKDFAESLLYLLNNDVALDKLATNGLEYVRANNWEDKKYLYLNIIRSLCH